MASVSVLVVDDDPLSRNTLARMLTRLGCTVTQAGDGLEAASMLASSAPDLVMTDLEMPRADGFAVLAAGQQAGVPVVIITAHASLEKGVEAMKRGAANFLAKPFTAEAVAAVLQDAASSIAARSSGARKERGERRGLLGTDDAFRSVLDLIERVADTHATILLTGESGTGKEVVARAIHNASGRRDAAFVPVNCGAIPEPLLESELFGHVRGAFTGATHARRGRFQLADGGTLFLDEIGDMPMALQVKLLRVIQERTIEVLGESQSVGVDVRIIAATHRNLEEMVAEGKFREDLFYRLNVVPLQLPPLRERLGDVPLLVEHFIVEAATAHGRKVTGLTGDAMAALTAYRWPGNVRELANIIERMVVLRGAGQLTIDDVPAHIRSPRAAAAPGSPLKLPDEGVDLAQVLQKVEGSLIDEALARTHGNRSQAAALLRINRTTLVEKLKRRGDED